MRACMHACGLYDGMLFSFLSHAGLWNGAVSGQLRVFVYDGAREREGERYKRRYIHIGNLRDQVGIYG